MLGLNVFVIRLKTPNVWSGEESWLNEEVLGFILNPP